MLVMEKAPAKINLSLDVLNKREDGYHDVEMVMTTIDLADRLELRELPADKIQLSLESRYVPSDERNLAYQAAILFKKHTISKKVFTSKLINRFLFLLDWRAEVLMLQQFYGD